METQICSFKLKKKNVSNRLYWWLWISDCWIVPRPELFWLQLKELGRQARMQLQACFLGLIILTPRHALRAFHDSPLTWVMELRATFELKRCQMCLEGLKRYNLKHLLYCYALESLLKGKEGIYPFLLINFGRCCFVTKWSFTSELQA